jgi:hypothetical protein
MMKMKRMNGPTWLTFIVVLYVASFFFKYKYREDRGRCMQGALLYQACFDKKKNKETNNTPYTIFS